MVKKSVWVGEGNKTGTVTRDMRGPACHHIGAVLHPEGEKMTIVNFKQEHYTKDKKNLGRFF